MKPQFQITPQRTARRLGVFKMSDREKLRSQELSRKLRDYIAPGVRKDRWERELKQGDPTAAMTALARGRQSVGLPPLDVFPITVEV